MGGEHVCSAAALVEAGWTGKRWNDAMQYEGGVHLPGNIDSGIPMPGQSYCLAT